MGEPLCVQSVGYIKSVERQKVYLRFVGEPFKTILCSFIRSIA